MGVREIFLKHWCTLKVGSRNNDVGFAKSSFRGRVTLLRRKFYPSRINELLCLSLDDICVPSAVTFSRAINSIGKEHGSEKLRGKDTRGSKRRERARCSFRNSARDKNYNASFRSATDSPRIASDMLFHRRHKQILPSYRIFLFSDYD